MEPAVTPEEERGKEYISQGGEKEEGREGWRENEAHRIVVHCTTPSVH